MGRSVENSEVVIELLAAREQGLRPPRMAAKFVGDEIIFLRASHGRKWSRERGESAAMFERRVIKNLWEDVSQPEPDAGGSQSFRDLVDAASKG
jgi:hypothetical protein